MIKVYTYYSVGGFTIFKIDGEEHERLDSTKEISTDNYQDYLPEAARFFDRGGSKVIYRYLKDKLVLTVKDIPSKNTDSDGRPVKCAVQFIGDGDIEDRDILDNIAASICSKMQEFEEFFAGLFFRRGGFGIQGDKLAEYIASFNGNTKSEYKDLLSKIKSVKDGLILFVALSENFRRDSFVREKTMRELQFTEKELNGAVILLKSELPSNIKPAETTTDNEQLRSQNEMLENRISELLKEVERLRSRLVLVDQYKQKYEQLKIWNKYLMYALGGALFIILLMIIF